MNTKTPKQIVLETIESLPDDATWEEILYHVYQLTDHYKNNKSPVTSKNIMQVLDNWFMRGA